MPIILSYVSSDGLIPVTFQQVTVSSTVIGVIIPGGIAPTRLVLSVHTGAIRVRWDGGDPTPTVGHLLQASTGAVNLTQAAELIGSGAITRLRMCRDGSSDSEIAYTIEM